MTKAVTTRKRVNLALQGGGAHGAFAWGVLDKILEDGRLEVEGISATSAGAMNAVVFAHGISLGGAQGAREKLLEFWREISLAGQLYSPVRAMPWERWLFGFGMEHSPSFHAFQALTHALSPYQLNPLNLNPLREVLQRVVDFEHLCLCNIATRLYISATNVRSGKIKVFRNADMSSDVILASACLPYVFQAVKIDNEFYWDGGYMGNPAIYPLIYNSASRDVIIVHINPIGRDALPTTAAEIFNRVNEISFNSSLMREMRAIAFVTQLIDDGALSGERYRRMFIHSIRSDEEMAKLSVASKLSPDWDFLLYLREAGRASAVAWLDEHFDDIGERSSIDIAETFL